MTGIRGDTLRLVREAATEADAEGALPIFLGELEKARVEILLAAIARRVVTRATHAPQEQLLSVAEVARRIGRSKWWVYENKDSLPIVRLPTGRYAFSERGLERWLARRRST